MWEQILPGLRIKIFMTVLLGVIYPLLMTGISQVIFPKQANGSLITAGDKVIVRRAAHSIRFVHPPGYSYYAMLREKLHWSEM